MIFKNALYIVLFVIALTMISCAGFGPRNQYISHSDNTYVSSSNPKLAVLVDKKLEYIGNFKKSRSEKWPDWADIVKYDLHVFANKSGNVINSAVIIYLKSFSSSDASWNLSCSFVKNAFVNEYVDLASIKFCNIVSLMGEDFFKNGVAHPLYEQGYKFNQVYLYSEFGTLVSAKREIFGVGYIETLEPQYYSSHRWRKFSKDDLSINEQQRLSTFIENSKRAFTLTESIAPVAHRPLSTQNEGVEKSKARRHGRHLDGLWNGSMVTKNTSRGNCAENGSFEGYVENNKITGKLSISTGYIFIIEGDIDENGNLVAGIASNQNNIGSFTGTFSDKIASGIWKDNFGCYGTWEAEKTEATDKSIESKLIELKKLHEKGLISDSEYKSKRNKILDEL